MRYSLKFIKVLVAVMVLVVVFTVGVYTGRVTQLKDSNNKIFTLPAHLNSILSDEYRLFTDYERDISYYVVPEALTLPGAGDTVSLSDGTTYSVLDSTYLGFYIKVDDSSVVAGLSGAPLWYDGKLVGYISTLYGPNLVYCVRDL